MYLNISCSGFQCLWRSKPNQLLPDSIGGALLFIVLSCNKTRILNLVTHTPSSCFHTTSFTPPTSKPWSNEPSPFAINGSRHGANVGRPGKLVLMSRAYIYIFTLYNWLIALQYPPWLMGVVPSCIVRAHNGKYKPYCTRPFKCHGFQTRHKKSAVTRKLVQVEQIYMNLGKTHKIIWMMKKWTELGSTSAFFIG